ncbi:hypothetical protein H4R24_001055 [Coemansia sp. RSA 988]|nr:hypothetical protein H4R24_001055 [Coemansia sp. RSA 988]
MANEERSKALYALPVESPTSSEPRVLSGNVVLPTMAIKITDDAHEPDAATVIIVEPDSSTSIELKIQRAFTLREDYLLAASTTPTPVGDISGFLSPHPPFLGEPPSAMASERHEITIDNDALFSALYQTRPNTQGLDTSPHITEPSRDISLVNNAAGDELDAIYPQNTPIIPFISDGVRQDVPSQDSDEKGDKGSVNSSGIASILQNIFHVPPEKITIDGRPVLENGMNQLNHGGTIDVTVMDPGNFKGGVLQNNLVKGSKGKDDDDDDDLLDDLDDDLDSEPVTHSLNVDRFRHRKKGNIRLGMSEPQTKDFSTVGVTDDSHSDSDDSDANAYDSDSGSDKDDDEDFELQYATPTKTITHSDNTILSLAPATTRSHRTEVPTSTDTPERITHSTIV